MAELKDSGQRREFSTGAVRDMGAGKGRCDLLPMDVCARFLVHKPNLDWGCNSFLGYMEAFQDTGDTEHLFGALDEVSKEYFSSKPDCLLEVAKHFEDGARKYDDNNWRLGIEAKVYIDSGVRHYLKLQAGWDDEPHDRATVWNLLCCIWTVENKPELNSYVRPGQAKVSTPKNTPKVDIGMPQEVIDWCLRECPPNECALCACDISECEQEQLRAKKELNEENRAKERAEREEK